MPGEMDCKLKNGLNNEHVSDKHLILKEYISKVISYLSSKLFISIFFFGILICPLTMSESCLNLCRRVLRWMSELVRAGESSGSSPVENREGEEERGRLHCTEHSRNSSHQLSSSSST
jgi:hypothetical protein